jgi:hypothetical protein
MREMTQANPPILHWWPNDEATLATGRELARRFIEEEREARKETRRGWIKGALTAVGVSGLSIVTALITNRVDRHYQRREEERERQQAGAPSPAPSTPLPASQPTP